MSEKASQLIAESNRLYDVINQYHNLYGVKVLEVMLAYNVISEIPPDNSTLPLLTEPLPDTAEKYLAEFFSVLAKEKIGNRSHERNLANIGYATTEDAIADIPNMFTGEVANQITVNLQKAKELFQVLDGCSMSKPILDIWNDVITLKNKLYEVTRVMGRV